jgi:hypothetical protein
LGVASILVALLRPKAASVPGLPGKTSQRRMKHSAEGTSPIHYLLSDIALETTLLDLNAAI